MIQIATKIPDELNEEVTILTNRTGLSKSAIMKQALFDFVQRKFKDDRA